MKLNEMKQELTHTAAGVGNDLAFGGRNVLLAGLGLAGAMVEGAWGAFDKLVEKGKDQDVHPEQLVREAGERVDSTVRAMRTAGTRSKKAVESVATSVLERFGVPSRKEVHNLIDRVERLNAKLATMGPQA
ncbi:MAG: phasin family protein [Holophagales bacterium]|nr:MAG: phasin family protein [Holophagales bacterium]